ncbi:MAG: hypothetical protein J6M62_05100, partial [Selenomonadaceae bacterium]|nr:hypothetical protein [Selenomonadaceae bacterium]MBO6304442.1 hypothetical protein [Selenomonadaceae bacterium]
MTLTTAAHNITNAKKQTDSFSYLVAILRNFLFFGKNAPQHFFSCTLQMKIDVYVKHLLYLENSIQLPNFVKHFEKV